MRVGLDSLQFRGFGFVTFADVGGVDKVLAQNSHDLDGKKVGERREASRRDYSDYRVPVWSSA